MKKNLLLRHGSIMLIAIVIGNLLAYLFHVYMGRALGPADYGILGSLMSIFYIISVPAGTITIVVSKFVSQYKVQEEYGKIKTFLRSSFSKLIKYILFASVIFFLFSTLIVRFLHIPSTMPVILLSIPLFFSLLLPINRGVLQGLQNFNQLGLNMILEGSLRFFLGVLLISFGFGVSGAILSYGLAYFFAFLLAFIPLRFLFKEKREKIHIPNIYQYTWFVLIAIACLTILTNIDILFVKHFFSSEQTGYYNVASMLGRILFFISMAMVSVMFPKVSELNISKKDHTSILKKCLFYMGLISLVISLVYLIFPSPIISLLFGSNYLDSVPLLLLFGIVMGIFAIITIITFYNLAIHNIKFVKLLISGVILEIILLSFFHNTLLAIIKVLLVTGVIMVIFSFKFMGR